MIFFVYGGGLHRVLGNMDHFLNGEVIHPEIFHRLPDREQLQDKDKYQQNTYESLS